MCVCVEVELEQVSASHARLKDELEQKQRAHTELTQQLRVARQHEEESQVVHRRDKMEKDLEAERVTAQAKHEKEMLQGEVPALRFTRELC